MLWSDFVVHYPSATRALQNKFKIHLLVVQKATKSYGNKCCLLYDGRHAVLDVNSETTAPLKCFLLSKKNKLIMTADCVNSLPPLTEQSYKNKIFLRAKPLWQLLGHKPTEDNTEMTTHPLPQTLLQLQDYVDRFQPPNTKLAISFMVRHNAKSPTVPWFVNPEQKTKTCVLNYNINLCAFTQSDYSIGYLEDVEPGLEKSMRRGQRIVQDYEKYRALWDQIEHLGISKEPPSARQNNCAAGVSVAHTGLNSLYNLGLISVLQMAQLSQELCATFSSLFVFLDEKFHLRHITYYDEEESFFRSVTCFENDCMDLNEGMTAYEENRDNERRDEATQTMLSFWQQVWTRRDFWIKKRQILLQPWMDRLSMLLSQKLYTAAKKPLTSPFARCLTELKKIIHHHHIYMYSSSDAHMHAIKFYLTHFAYQKVKNCRGVWLKAQSDDTLVKLSVSGLTVLNTHTYFACKNDADFFSALAQPWTGPQPSEIVISHRQKHLQKQHVAMGPDKQTAASYCHQYGFLFAKTILCQWRTFGKFLLDQFGYEIHGQTTAPSTSYLGFQCIWTRYIKLAGPMVQTLERCKPYYEDLLRDSSRGGFMFSVEEALRQGDHLSSQSTASLAQSIAEYDLISAYGYAAANCYVPSGFCTGFQLSPSVVDMNNKPVLERLDTRARHKSFEFRAVYKVIDKLTRKNQEKVRSVYHNYSPMGVFTLGKYNLDLAIVTESGKLLLLNMDGRHAHSCDTCLPVSENHRFVQGQTHAQLRAKSDQRDADILTWVRSFNANSLASGEASDVVSYAVIHDCHTPGYTTASLAAAFATEPTLMKLVQGYKVTDQLGMALTETKFHKLVSGTPDSVPEWNEDYTFIAKAAAGIDCPPEYQPWTREDPRGSFSVGPLIVYRDQHNDQDGKDSPQPKAKKRGIRQELAWNGTVVMTRDYCEWLKGCYGNAFHLDQLDWILFYKTEPVLNFIYQELVEMRSSTSDPVLVTFIKRLVNLSAGFFGAHASQKGKTTYRLISGMPQNYAFYRHSVDSPHVIDLQDATYHLLETKPWPKLVAKRQPSKSAIPFFLTIVEFGKLRLIQLLHFIRQHAWPGCFRLLYANIDNAIICLGNDADVLEGVVMPTKQISFRACQPHFLTSPENPTKTPGLAEIKWQRGGVGCNWKFITVRTQHYCIGVQSNPTQDLHKTAGWSNVSSEQAFAWAEDLLRGRRVAVPQTRRVSKMLSMDTRDVVFHY